MHIVIVGAGAVGSYLAARLAGQSLDVVVIEADPARAAEVQAEVDCLVLVGNGASTTTLAEARVKDADVVIAVTNSDAANILACQNADAAGAKTTIARVEDDALLGSGGVKGVDVVIDPGESLAQELLLLVGKEGASEIVEFADGELVLLGGHVEVGASLDGLSLRELRQRVKGWDWIIVALVREGRTIVARGDTAMQAGDHIFVMARKGATAEPTELMGVQTRRVHRAFVMGATRSALLTAGLLAQRGIHVTLIDKDAERLRSFQGDLDKVVLVAGDPTDPKVLRDEGVDRADTVLALTGWDEVNILACLVSRAMGARSTVSRFHRLEYIGLLEGLGIDAGVSSRLSAANAILQFVRRGTILSVATFQDTEAEAIELEVGADSEAVGKKLADIHLSRKAIVGGVLRSGRSFVPHGDTVVQAGDRLILFALPGAIPKLEKLFG